jgi:hypothetical protein
MSRQIETPKATETSCRLGGLNILLCLFFVSLFISLIDAHREGVGGGGIKVYPPSKIFAKLVNKYAIKTQKGIPSAQNFHNPYIPSLPRRGQNLMDPPPRFSNRVHL